MPQNVKMRSRMSKLQRTKGGTFFLRHSVVNIKMAQADGHHCMTVTLDRVKVISACTIHIGLPAYPTM